MVYDAIYVVFCAVIYSLEYSGILYIMCFPILVMHGEPADLLSIIMQNIPSTGAGGDRPLTPS